MACIKIKAISICRKLQDNGYKAGFVGGAVRDSFLGKEPHDYDIATSARPEQIKEVFNGDADLGAIEVGEAFGIVSMWSKECGCAFEVASFRIDGDYSDGRRPDSVQFTDDVVEDLSRRDFTCNAMFFDPVNDALVDPFDGKKDVSNEVIRFVGEPMDRIEEDRLRILRAYRLSAKLGFEIEPNAVEALREMSTCVSPFLGVSQERITDELEKILLTGFDSVDFALAPMARNGLLWKIIPELEMQLMDHDSKWHSEFFENFGTAILSHTFFVVQNAGKMILEDDALSKEDKLRLMWAALLHDVGKPYVAEPNKEGRTRYLKHDVVGKEMAEEILTRMKLPNKRISVVAGLVRRHMDVHNLPVIKDQAKVRKLLGSENIGLLLKLGCADTLASKNEDSSKKSEDVVKTLMNSANKWTLMLPEMLPKPIVTGDDLIAAGLKPGPFFKRALEIAYDEQLRGTTDPVKLRNKAVAEIKQRAKGLVNIAAATAFVLI